MIVRAPALTAVAVRIINPMKYVTTCLKFIKVVSDTAKITFPLQQLNPIAPLSILAEKTGNISARMVIFL